MSIKKYLRKTVMLSVATAVVLGNLGCSGGGGSSSSNSDDNTDSGDTATYSVDAKTISLPEQFSIVLDASKIEKQSPVRFSMALKSAAFEAADSDYSQTEANIWDANFADMLNFPNFLAKLLSQSRASDFVNQGKYIALFDELEKPFAQEMMDDGMGGNASESSKKEQAVFEVIQENSDGALTIKMWYELEDPYMPEYSMIVYGETVVTQNQSAEYPLGEFTIYYTTVFDDGDSEFGDKNALRVTADDENILIDYKNIWEWNEDVYTYKFQNSVSKDYTSGAFTQLSSYTYGGQEYSDSFEIAYNESVIAEKSSYSGTAYYDISNKKQMVYNYELFNENDGSRLDLNMGMPLSYTGSDGYNYYGYASPYGTWIDGPIADGDRVTSELDGKVYTAEIYRGYWSKYTSNGDYINYTPDTAIDVNNLVDYEGNTYSFDKDTFMLIDNSDGSSVDATGDEYVWKDLTDAAGDYYYWSISNSEWDKAVVLTDSNGNSPQFDDPLKFNYTHTVANDRNGNGTQVGTTLDLSYEGYGLYVPWEWDGSTYSAASLKDGAILTDTKASKYVVKATDIGIEYTTLDSKPSNAPSFISADLDSVEIDTSDFEYETLGNIDNLSIKVINKVVQ